MKKLGCISILLLLSLFGADLCHAATVKAFVNRFTVSVGENREELKGSMQVLLMSRLNSEEIQATDKPSDADILIDPSYIAFGTVFSLDALLKTASGQFVDRVFVQGDTQNELIPSVVEMAKRIRYSILKWHPELSAKARAEMPLPVTALKAAVVPVKKEVRKEPKAPPAPKAGKVPEKPWVSQRLAERYSFIAAGSDRGADGVEIFAATERSLSFYLKGERLQIVSEMQFEADERVVGIDVADLDGNGTQVYVSILKLGLPASQVYQAEKSLRKVKENIPYLLRSIALDGKEKKIYAQRFDANADFIGDVYQLAKSGDDYSVKNPMQLPLFGNLYNFGRFIDAKGKPFFVVAHPEGYLLVYSKDKKQLWKSREKFGGSEVALCKAEKIESAVQMPKQCSSYMPQRIQVTDAREVIVSRNTGLYFESDKRNYSKNGLLKLQWDGSSLQEIWRSKQAQGYLADFSYDSKSGRLLLLEVEPKTESGGERGSRLVMKGIE